jgi:hypothetical protein
MPSSGMWRRVGIVRNDVSDERCSLLADYFYLEDRCDTFLRNVGSNKTHGPTPQKAIFFKLKQESQDSRYELV